MRSGSAWCGTAIALVLCLGPRAAFGYGALFSSAAPVVGAGRKPGVAASWSSASGAVTLKLAAGYDAAEVDYDMITTLPAQIGTMLANSGSDAVRLFPCPVPMPNVVVKQFWHSRYHRDPGNQWLRAICADQARLGMMRIADGEVPEHQPTLIE